MKIFVALLIVANIAAWIWQSGFSSPVAVVTREQPAYTQAKVRLALLSETSPVPRLPSVAPNSVEPSSAVVPEPVEAVPAPTDEQPAPTDSWCAVSEVLTQHKDAENLLAAWKTAGGVGEIASDEEPVSSTWWVHLPPFANEAAARIVLNELQQKKIDSYYMRSGELAGGISLGVFSREESARKVQAELRVKGYVTEVREIQRTEERSRLYLILENGSLGSNQLAAQTLAKFGVISLDEIPCK